MDDTFLFLETEDGEIECELLYEFDYNDKHYRVYTDNILEDGLQRYYGLVLNGEEYEMVEDEEDWDIIEEVIDYFTE